VVVAGVEEKLYLMGRPPLKGFLRFLRAHAATPVREAAVTDAWQSACDVVRRLAQEEAGVADEPVIGEPGPEYDPLLADLLRDPLVRYGFNTVPTEVALVELDRLVVHQPHIDLTFARQLAARLGPAPGREEVFRTCLPFDHPQPPVQWSRAGDGRFVFLSPSNDLRFLGPMSLEPRHITGCAPPGALVGVVGLAVGFGSNFLSAVHAERRLILNNGSHRAYALRTLGITHVPCIVQHVASRDELDVVAAPRVRSDPDLYLSDSRPPLLKDYFDARLHLVVPVQPRVRQVTVRFQVEEDFVPAL